MSSRRILIGAWVFSLAVSWQGTSFGQNNPSGWIQTKGWNMLLPLLNPAGCSGGGTDNMKLNWVAPHDLKSEDPKAGTEWADIAFGGDGITGARAAGFDLGGLNPNPIWVSNAFLAVSFLLPPAALPNGDVVDFQALIDFINANVIPVVPGSHALPSDNVLAIATTYVDNVSGGPLEVEVCSASDDSVQVYINNKLVTNVSSCRGTAGDCAELRRAVLPAGKSRITGLVWEGGGGWGMRIGIRLAGTSSNLADGNGIVNFLGAGAANDTGQTQYCLTRSSTASAFSCPNLDVKVTLTGSGPGADGDLLTVTEMLMAASHPAISITGVTNGGVVTDKYPPLATVGDLCNNLVVGVPCGAASITTTAAGPGTCPIPEYTSVAQTGGDIWDCGDVFEFAYCGVSGDFDVAINMTSKAHSLGAISGDANGKWGKFGLMARKSLATDARHTMIQDHLPDLTDPFRAAGRTVNSGCGGVYEDGGFAAAANGGAALSAHPQYFRLTRRGNVVQCWASDDGTKVNPCLGGNPAVDGNWSAGHADDWGEAPRVFLGFANSEHNSGPACSTQTIKFQIIRAAVTLAPPHNDPNAKAITWTNVSRGTVNNGLMYDLKYNAVGSTTLLGTIPGVAIAEGPSSIDFNPNQSGPVGDFDTSHAIGNPPTFGSTTYDAGTDTYTQMSTGADIWDGGDDAHFAYKVVTGDFEATARITSVGVVPPVGGSRWGRYGLMARWTCDRNSKYSMACQLGTDFRDFPRHQFRVNHLQNDTTRDHYQLNDGLLDSSPTVPWVRLTRVGNAIYSFLSDDDGSGHPKKWCLIGSDSAPSMPASLLVGMASHNHGSAGTNPLVVVFDHFECVPPDPRDPRTCSGVSELASLDFEEPGDLGIVVQGGGFAPGLVGGRLRVNIQDIGGQANAIWYGVVSDPGAGGAPVLDDGFFVEFDAFMTRTGLFPDGNPADGFAFVAMATGVSDGLTSAVAPFPAGLGVFDLRGDGGGALAYEGFTLRERTECHPSFAVEMDNWVGGGEPGNEPGDGGSPGSDGNWHIGLDVNASVSSIQTNVNFGVPTASLPDIFNANGAHIEVMYRPDGAIDVWASGVDRSGAPVARRKVLSTYIPPLPSGDVLMGFVGGTGGATCTQEIDNFKLSTICCEFPDGVSITGAAQAVQGSPVALNAVVTGADQGGAATYSWQVIGGSATIDHPDAASVNVTPTSINPVVVEVSYNDGVCSSTVKAQHTISVTPQSCNLSIVCSRNPDNESVHIAGSVTGPGPDCACNEIIVYRNGVQIFRGPPAPDGMGDFPLPADCFEPTQVSFEIVCLGPAGEGARGSCSVTCQPAGGLQLPGDCNQDGRLSLSDVICTLNYLFLGEDPASLPCGDGASNHAANVALLDANGDNGGGLGKVDIGDAIYVLNRIAFSGPPHVLGESCVRILDCPSVSPCPGN